VIRCEVCGTDNDDKLTFCANCGHRLRARQRAVPPTPATGIDKPELPKEDTEPTATIEEGWDQEQTQARLSRPSAPPLELQASEPPGHEEEVPPGKAKCGACGTLSPKGYRFCIACGSVLKKVTRPKPSATRVPAQGEAKTRSERSRPSAPPRRSGPPSRRRSEPRAQEGEEPPTLARPRPQLDLELPGRDRAAKPTFCGSCGGACNPTDTFCKHCGTTLPAGLPADGEAPVGSAKGPRAAPPSRAPKAKPAVRLAQAAEPVVQKLPQESAGPSDDAPPRRPPGRPVEPATGRLVVIVEDGTEGRAIDLAGRQVDLGSRDGDIVLTEDRYLSPRHARFFRQNDAWYVRDLDSINGIYRRLREPTTLRDGDLVLLGLEVLKFELVEHGERGLGHAVEHGVLVFGSPAATRRARLLQRTVEGITRDVYHLVADETTIGRETGDIVFTSDPFMSRRHAAIQWDETTQSYVLTDLNSSNGTYLALREDVRLHHGDFIRLGQHLFRVDLPRPEGARR